MPKYVYKNGNSIVVIDSTDGTKERMTKDDDFDLEFPESLDISCTSFCTANCPFCYAKCSVNGHHADIMSAKFVDTLRPYTEVALQLNDLTHPQMIDFLYKLKDKRIFTNITVNQIHFEQKEEIIKYLIEKDLIKGMGISLKNPTPEFIERVKKYPNAVIHVINGIVSPEDLEAMRDQGLKLLILGYKNLGRGVEYKEKNNVNVEMRQRYLYDVLETLPNHFRVLSMDNLAIEQLKPQRFINKEDWNTIFQGEEGTASMFIDLVKGKFGVSSLCSEDEMFPLMNDIVDMFNVVKKVA